MNKAILNVLLKEIFKEALLAATIVALQGLLRHIKESKTEPTKNSTPAEGTESPSQ